MISPAVQADLLKYSKYHNSDNFADFSFICSDGVKIPAHRLMISANSPMMEAMLATSMTESSSQQVKVDDINSNTMIEILRFIYTKNLLYINNDQIIELLYGAEKYQLPDLKDFCKKTMINNISIDNIFEYYSVADQYDLKDLLECCIRFIKA